MYYIVFRNIVEYFHQISLSIFSCHPSKYINNSFDYIWKDPEL